MLSQPATSNALARLRHLTNDALFVRASGGLQPTPVAIALAQQIRPALHQIQTALWPEPEFDPKTSDRVFTIGMTDYVEFVLLPRLLETLQSSAPQSVDIFCVDAIALQSSSPRSAHVAERPHCKHNH